MSAENQQSDAVLAEEAKQFITITLKTAPRPGGYSDGAKLDGSTLVMSYIIFCDSTCISLAHVSGGSADDFQYEARFNLSDVDFVPGHDDGWYAKCAVGACIEERERSMPTGKHTQQTAVLLTSDYEIGERLRKALAAYQKVYGKKKSSF